MCVKDKKNRLGRFTWLNKQGVEYVRDKILRVQIEDHVKSVLKSRRTYRILDIGCGDFPYLRENAYSENADSEELLPIFDKKSVEIRLIDPDTKISIPKGWKDFAELFPCRFYHFLEDGKYSEERTKKFDLIILSAVPHELYLEWCLSRVMQKSEEELKEVAIPSCSREEFCVDLFRKLSALLNSDGYILLVENYCPKRVKQEAQLRAQQIQYLVINHADSPSAFFPTEEYVDVAKNLGFKCDFQDSVRCVDVEWIKALDKQKAFTNLEESAREDIKLAFEGRRFGCKLIRKIAECPSDVDDRNDSELHRGFLFDMSSVINVDKLDSVLHKWVSVQTETDIKVEYKNVFWGQGDKSVFVQLIKKCYDVVRSTFSYEIITYPKLFSCWVSINSLITGGRFSVIDDTGRMTPILYTDKKGVKVYMRGNKKLQDWNEIAFNSFSSIHALEKLLSESGVDDDARKMARSPSVYNYMRRTPSVRSLTLTYARPLFSCQDLQPPADIQLATQEDAINALELGHGQSNGKRKTPETQKHHLIVIDFKKVQADKYDADPCLRAAQEINEYMDGGYYTDVKDKFYVKYLTAIYLDFLFLRRFESGEVDINKLLKCFEERWLSKIHDVFGENDEVGKNLIAMIKGATEVARNKDFTIDKLPRAFITFSSPIYLDDVSDKAYANRRNQPPGSMMIFTDKIIPKDALDSMVAVTEHTFDVIRALELKWVVEKRNQELLLSNTKSAIGSIMSRNGSHNIGSHVLAALSHNVGTMPDDRVLYQYIQHRMDYIATVTTDFPTWTQPTMLLGSLMKGFLSQRHLLDHIAESEKLSAWKFQGPESLDKGHKGKHWIEFHVRKRKQVDGQDVYVELIEYPSGNVKLEEDVALAIPGGAVGYHAFYTILENIIRNAAKHDWSVFENGKARKEIEGDLPIYIDFDDDPEKDNVEIEIWTRLREEEKAKVSLTNVDDWHKKLEAGEKRDLEDFSKLPLPLKLQVLIERSFITDNGQLRRENWGLAEMKISAGYLRRSGIDVIGGLKRDEYDPEKALILPTAAKKTVVVGSKPQTGTYLAYKFSIPKPRELLVIVNTIDKSENTKRRIIKAGKYGVYIKTWQQILDEGKTNVRALELNYRFIVHPAVTKEVLINDEGVKFPFRVLSGKEANGVNGMVPLFEKYSEVVKELLNGTGEVKKVVEEVLKAVYECWCSHIVNNYRTDIELGEDGKIGLLIAPSEASHTGGHSLISDADILKYVMRECFEDCVKQYKVLCGDLPESERLKLDEFANLCKGAREIDSVALDKNKDNPQDNIARFLHKWVSGATSPSLSNSKRISLLSSIKKEIENGYHVEGESTTDNSDDLPPDMASIVEIGTNNIEEGNRGAAVREVKRMLNKGSIDGFIEYIASVLEQVKALFKQYEENIVSLPNGYRVDTIKTVGDGGNSENSVELGGFAKVVFDVNHANAGSWIAYRRHDNSLTKKIMFAEPLSGTQSYLTQIARLAENLKSRGETMFADDFGLCTRLLENGLMRMLVIDERVAKFVREHKTEVESTYKSMGISVLDDNLKNDTGVDDETIEFKKTRCNKSLSGKFEILIIHQGVLDKWFPNDKNDKTKMGQILDGFKKMVKYVVITTGRGTPSNIPEDAHLIPFAVVEAALFRKYPEKLILVDAVMNVLAIGKHENEGG